MASIPKVSIVIRAYNEDAHIGKLLSGIAVQRLVPHEVILVDSGSTDATVSIAERFGVKIVTIDKQHFTFGRALNLGCASATGDILVFVSAHVYPTHATWLEQLVRPFEDSRVVLSYGKQRGAAVNKFSEHQIFAKWFPEKPALPQASYFANNANCAVRRETWERHRYNEMLTGLEDLDWAKRAQAEGGWIAYVPSAGIIHVHDETWPGVQNRYRREAIALRQIDPRSRFGFLDFVRLTAANVLADMQAAARQHMLAKELGSILNFRFRQFYGTLQGYSGPSDISDALRRRFYYPAAPDEIGRDASGEDHYQIDYEALTARGKLPTRS